MTSKHRLATRVLASLAVALAVFGTPGAQPRDKRISLDEGRELASEIVKVHNPGPGVSLTSSPRGFDPDFYFFCATWPNPTGSPVIGYFAVNPWTGDVWNADDCEHLTSKSVQKTQADIRKRFHFKREEYAKLREKMPLCARE